MKNLRILSLIGLVCLVSFLVPKAKAEVWDQKITFSEPVELPGIVLPAGTYIFRRVDYVSNPNMVQVLSQDRKTIYGTFRTIPDYRVNDTTESSIIFEERAAGTPSAIKEWFFPDPYNGHEFVYPEPLQLAKTDEPENANKPAESAEPQSTEVQSMKNEPATVEHSEQTMPPPQPEQQAETQLPPQPEQEAEAQQPPQEAMARELPKTASLLPLTGLLGMLLVAGAFGLRLYSGKID